MHRLLPYICVPVLILLASCGGRGPSEQAARLEAGPKVCGAGPESPAGSLDPGLATIGPSSNAVRQFGDHIWIVESGSNTVSRLSVNSGKLAQALVDVGEGRNPYDVVADPTKGRVFVTNYLSNSVTVADAETGEIVEEIESDAFRRPEGIAATDRWLYVTNANYVGGESLYGRGTIAIVDRETLSVVGTAPTRWKNPQYARLVDTPEGPRIAVSDSGVIRLERSAPTTPGGLELWKPNGKPSPSSRETFELGYEETERVGAPGRPLPTPDGEHLYFTSATAPVVFKFDLADKTWMRDADDPIRLYDSDQQTLHHGAMGPNGVLYVTSFNRDALYLFDTNCDERLAGPIDLGTSTSMLEGPHGIALVADGPRTRAYYIMSLAHAMGRVDLRF